MTKRQLRGYAKFDAGFPDDGVFNASGNVLTPAGRNIAEFLAAELSRRGFKTTTIKEQGDYGWTWMAKSGNFTTWFLLQAGWLLMTEPRPSFMDSLTFRDTTAKCAHVLGQINEILRTDRRFGRVRWYTPKEHGEKAEPGADSPV